MIRFGLVLAGVLLVGGAAFARDEALLGPLARVAGMQIAAPWQGSAEDGWFVLRNPDKDDAEQSLLVPVGLPKESGRLTSVNVSLKAPDSEAAIGLFLANGKAGGTCVMEVTAARAANLFCYVGDKYEEIASLPDVARLDGSDVLEVAEVPGVARFFLNGEEIGEVHDKPALGGDIGILAYDRGTFGIAAFQISDLNLETKATGETGSGLPPPKGGMAADSGAAAADAGGAAADGGNDLATIIGPLADVVSSTEPRPGWETYMQDGWLVLDNAKTESDSLFYSTEVGMPGDAGRVTEVSVGMGPPDGSQMSDIPYSAVGIILYNGRKDASCIGEVTGGGDGLLICFEGEQGTEVGRLKGVAKLDGSDRIALLEVPGKAMFTVNGQTLGQVEDSPSQGSEVGILAYERGRFYANGFTMVSGGDVAADVAAETGPEATGAPEGPLPMFDGDSGHITERYLGVISGVMLHEFGHGLIGELQLPATGPEEDVVDIFSALRISSPAALDGPTDEADRLNEGMATYAALQWYYSGKAQAQLGGGDVPWQDEHTADLKRFRNSFCVMYGGNPDLFQPIAEQVGMDERTLSRCEDEFAKQNRAWRTILAPHTRVSAWHPEGQRAANAPGAAITAQFEPSSRRVGDMVKQIIGDSGTMQGLLDGLAADYVLPRPLTVVFRDCGEMNAWYSPQDGTITMCYDLIENIIVMVSDTEMGTVGGEDPATAAAAGGGAAGGTTGTNNPFVSDPNPFDGKAGAAPAFDEMRDLGMPETRELFLAPYDGPTPLSNPLAEVITTADLAALLQGDGPVLLIDTRGEGQSLPKAVVVTDIGRDGSLRDGFQKMIGEFLSDQAPGGKSEPVVFFGAGMTDRTAYNAALRAGALGWQALWYRGGIEAWVANGLPVEAPQ